MAATEHSNTGPQYLWVRTHTCKKCPIKYSRRRRWSGCSPPRVHPDHRPFLASAHITPDPYWSCCSATTLHCFAQPSERCIADLWQLPGPLFVNQFTHLHAAIRNMHRSPVSASAARARTHPALRNRAGATPLRRHSIATARQHRHRSEATPTERRCAAAHG